MYRVVCLCFGRLCERAQHYREFGKSENQSYYRIHLWYWNITIGIGTAATTNEQRNQIALADSELECYGEKNTENKSAKWTSCCHMQ